MNERQTDRLRVQLDHAQQLAGETEQRIAEARTILRSSLRRNMDVCKDLNEQVLEAEKDAEFLTDRLRKLTMELVVEEEKARRFRKELVKMQGIEVCYTDGILSVFLPALIPHRKTTYTDYLYKPLCYALQDWKKTRKTQGEEVPFFETGTVCFLHAYDQGRPSSRIRDHDNIEEKQALDLIRDFFLKSDRGDYLDTYHETVLAESDWTKIFLMKKEAFPHWITARR